MTLIRFTAPPLPHFIACGFHTAPPGFKHINRRNFGLFDLLVISQGTIFIGEEDRHYEVPADHALILRPDCHHFPTKASIEAVNYYWLHFHTGGSWNTQHQGDPAPSIEHSPGASKSMAFEPFPIPLPQFTRLHRPSSVYEEMDRQVQLETESHRPEVRWEQQLIFQRVLRLLFASMETSGSSPTKLCAQQAASYLRANYRNPITAKELGEQLNFHPVHIARCMQKEFGCSPFEYLTRFRIEQAKLLMVRTDMSIARVAEEVGFTHAAYFSTCFLRYEGQSPRSYRRRFS